MDDLRVHLTPKVVHSSPDLPRPGQTSRGRVCDRGGARERLTAGEVGIIQVPLRHIHRRHWHHVCLVAANAGQSQAMAGRKKWNISRLTSPCSAG